MYVQSNAGCWGNETRNLHSKNVCNAIISGVDESEIYVRPAIVLGSLLC